MIAYWIIQLFPRQNRQSKCTVYYMLSPTVWLEERSSCAWGRVGHVHVQIINTRNTTSMFMLSVAPGPVQCHSPNPNPNPRFSWLQQCALCIFCVLTNFPSILFTFSWIEWLVAFCLFLACLLVGFSWVCSTHKLNILLRKQAVEYTFSTQQWEWTAPVTPFLCQSSTAQTKTQNKNPFESPFTALFSECFLCPVSKGLLHNIQLCKPCLRTHRGNSA